MFFLLKKVGNAWSIASTTDEAPSVSDTPGEYLILDTDKDGVRVTVTLEEVAVSSLRSSLETLADVRGCGPLGRESAMVLIDDLFPDVVPPEDPPPADPPTEPAEGGTEGAADPEPGSEADLLRMAQSGPDGVSQVMQHLPTIE